MSEEGEKEGSGDKRKRLPGNEQTTEATKDDNVKQTSADGRDVITYEDILEAMQALGFDNYVEPLSTYMKKYREAFPGKNKSLKLANFVPHLHNPNVNDSSGSTNQNSNFARKLVPLAPKTTALAGDTDLSNSVPEKPQNVHFMDTTTGEHSSQLPSPGETSQLIPIRPSTLIDSITNGQDQEAGEFTSQNGDCAPDSSPLAPRTTALAGDTNLSSSVPGVPQNVHFVDTTTGQLSSQMPSPGETSQLIPTRPSTVIDSITNGQNQEAGESTSQNGDCAPSSSPLAPQTTALTGDTNLSSSMPGVPQNVHFVDTTTGQLSSQMPSPGETSQLIPIRPSTVIDSI
ncbi:unnamed protein product, partial [Gongylonema pulchrum]|uniref:Transcription initiation factor TFIID subunit 10 n=1 Tax=Gongylonema pulchrum TaxID=637853 RepID=A0A183E9N2_9BILA